jgi:hypothetical protein
MQWMQISLGRFYIEFAAGHPNGIGQGTGKLGNGPALIESTTSETHCQLSFPIDP